MAYITWQDDFSVNVKVLDDQHKGLIEIINSLHEALLANKARELQKQTVNRMIDYAAQHFAAEEKYMKQYSYPGYGLQKQEHDRFTAKAKELQERMEKVGFVLTLEILNFLKDWLHHHILKVDKQYSAFFAQKGLS